MFSRLRTCPLSSEARVAVMAVEGLQSRKNWARFYFSCSNTNRHEWHRRQLPSRPNCPQPACFSAHAVPANRSSGLESACHTSCIRCGGSSACRQERKTQVADTPSFPTCITMERTNCKATACILVSNVAFRTTPLTGKPSMSATLVHRLPECDPLCNSQNPKSNFWMP